MMECRICGNQKDNQKYEVKEMMYGYRDVHPYFQCSKCGCLQINEFPKKIQKYYNNSYYSYSSPSLRHRLNMKRLLIRRRNIYALFGKGGGIGKILNSKYPTTQFKFLQPIRARLSIDSTILDVGCGSGQLLQSLRQAGFRRLLGVDPFIDHDIIYENGLRINKQSIHEARGSYDMIMFNHSFEHVPDPIDTLQCVFGLLNPGGYCVIQIPTVSSYAWKHYGVHWVQLDAPRHFFLHSLESMEMLSNKMGFELCNMIYNSTAFQFWGSEQYIKDIPLKEGSIFSEKEISLFEKRADELNATKQGDQVVFYLRKPAKVVHSIGDKMG